MRLSDRLEHTVPLGLNADMKLPDFNGREQRLLDDREPVRELIS